MSTAEVPLVKLLDKRSFFPDTKENRSIPHPIIKGWGFFLTSWCQSPAFHPIWVVSIHPLASYTAVTYQTLLKR